MCLLVFYAESPLPAPGQGDVLSVLCSPSGAQNSAHMLSIFALSLERPPSGRTSAITGGQGGELSASTQVSPILHPITQLKYISSRVAHKAEWQLRPPCFSCLRPPPGEGWQQGEESESSPDPHPPPPPAGGYGLVGTMHAWERDLRGK